MVGSSDWHWHWHWQTANCWPAGTQKMFLKIKIKKAIHPSMIHRSHFHITFHTTFYTVPSPQIPSHPILVAQSICVSTSQLHLLHHPKRGRFPSLPSSKFQ